MTRSEGNDSLTVGGTLKWGTASLHGHPSVAAEAFREARDILCHVLGKDESWLIAHDRDAISDEDLERYSELILRRGQSEPLAYGLGSAWFMGREYRVTRDTLIPRPATEHIVEEAMKAAEEVSAETLVDIGTGSGIIAINLALGRPKSSVWATDISEGAIAVARENSEAAQTPLIKFRRCDLAEAVPEKVWARPFAVVANLPYIPEADWESLAAEIREHEPKTALTAGEDGLDEYRRLIGSVPQTGTPFALCLEMLPKQEFDLTELMKKRWPGTTIKPIRNLAGDAIGLCAVVSA